MVGDKRLESICAGIFFYLKHVADKFRWTTREYRAASRVLRDLSGNLNDLLKRKDRVHALARQIIGNYVMQRESEIAPDDTQHAAAGVDPLGKTSFDLAELLSKLADSAARVHRPKHRPIDQPLRSLLLHFLSVRGRHGLLRDYEIALLFYAAELHWEQPRWAENAERRTEAFEFPLVLAAIQRRIELLRKKPIGPLERMLWEERRRERRLRTRLHTR